MATTTMTRMMTMTPMVTARVALVVEVARPCKAVTCVRPVAPARRMRQGPVPPTPPPPPPTVPATASRCWSAWMAVPRRRAWRLAKRRPQRQPCGQRCPAEDCPPPPARLPCRCCGRCSLPGTCPTTPTHLAHHRHTCAQTQGMAVVGMVAVAMMGHPSCCRRSTSVLVASCSRRPTACLSLPCSGRPPPRAQQPGQGVPVPVALAWVCSWPRLNC